MNQLADTVRRAMGVPDHPIVHHPPRNEVKHAFSDHSKVHDTLRQARPESTLDEGVERMVAWAREHGPRKTPTFQNIEIMKNLPPSWLDA